jgi:hypothetical protein
MPTADLSHCESYQLAPKAGRLISIDSVVLAQDLEVSIAPSIYLQVLLYQSLTCRIAGGTIRYPLNTSPEIVVCLAPGQASVIQNVSVGPATICRLLFDIQGGTRRVKPATVGWIQTRRSNHFTAVHRYRAISGAKTNGVSVNLYRFAADSPPPTVELTGPAIVIPRLSAFQLMPGSGEPTTVGPREAHVISRRTTVALMDAYGATNGHGFMNECYVIHY